MNVKLTDLETILYRENSCVDPQDVPRLLLVICNEAVSCKDGEYDDFVQFRKELQQQITPPPEWL